MPEHRKKKLELHSISLDSSNELKCSIATATSFHCPVATIFFSSILRFENCFFAMREWFTMEQDDGSTRFVEFN